MIASEDYLDSAFDVADEPVQSMPVDESVFEDDTDEFEEEEEAFEDDDFLDE